MNSARAPRARAPTGTRHFIYRKKTPGGAVTHTRDTRAHTSKRITQKNLTTFQPHQSVSQSVKDISRSRPALTPPPALNPAPPLPF